MYECQVSGTVNITPRTNTGIVPGSYSFAPNTGTNNLTITGINYTVFSYNGTVNYTITIGFLGEDFSWNDDKGNSGSVHLFLSNVTYTLSYGITIDFTIGTFSDGDTYTLSISNNVVWWQVSPDYRGIRPRTLFNGQKLILEAVLNQYFNNNSASLPVVFRQPSTLEEPDIYIQNTQLENFVFLVGETENDSSDVVITDVDATNYIESSGDDYNFNEYDFTIFVPVPLYFVLASGSVNVVLMNTGIAYTAAPTIYIDPPTGYPGPGLVQATAIASIIAGHVHIQMINYGSGYTSLPAVSISGGTYLIPATAKSVVQDNSNADNIIRAVANQYVIAGMTYDIQTY